MIKQDYITRLIKQFSERATFTLDKALIKKDPSGVGETEEAIGELLELDPNTVLSLEPDSFVLMVTLGGTGEMVSRHIAYVLDKVADAYLAQVSTSQSEQDRAALQELAALRRAQSAALLAHYGIAALEVPDDLATIDKAIKAVE